MRWLVFVLALMVALPAAAKREKKPMSEAQKIVDGAVKANGPGIAVAVIRGQTEIFRACRGLADVKSGKPITPDSLFDLASVSKQFTGLAIAMLAEDGKLALDDEARKHLTELRERTSARQILVRDLIYMMDGQLPSYDQEYESYEGVSNDDVVKFVVAQKYKYKTGAKHEYSNTAYSELGTMVARLGGGSYHGFLTKRVFEPCGMKRTLALENPRQELSGRVTGYSKGEPTESPNWLIGDGNVFTTLDDFVRFEIAMRAKKLVKPTTWELMHRRGKLDDGTDVDYGFGLIPYENGADAMVYHGGSWAGTATQMYRYLDPKSLSVLVLSNEDTLDTEDIAEQLANAFWE
jgi:CubicO group peptidase (beta-lactamase class C family)